MEWAGAVHEEVPFTPGRLITQRATVVHLETPGWGACGERS